MFMYCLRPTHLDGHQASDSLRLRIAGHTTRSCKSHATAVQVTFEQDVVLSQANEYEVLQLLLADMRDRLTSFQGAYSLETATEACLPGCSLQASLADVPL